MGIEMLDLVDAHDRVIGMVRRDQYTAGGQPGFVRVVNGFLVDENGRLWIPRRTAARQFFPSCLDFSVGGYVTHGESYEEAFFREMEEEVCLKGDTRNCRLLRYLSPLQHAVSSFMKVYEVRASTSPPYNRADFCDAAWLEPAELLRRVAAGDAAKGDLAEVVRLCYA